MAYVPVVWVEGVTKVGPTNLNHLEGGVQAAAAVADAALPTPAGSNGQFLKKVGGVWVPTSFAASDIPNFPTDATKALLGDGSWAQIANAQIAAAAAVALSKLADPGAGNVVTSAGSGAIAAKPPGYEYCYQERTTSITILSVAETAATTIVTAPVYASDGVTPVYVEFWAPSVAYGGSGYTTGINLWMDGADIGRLFDGGIVNTTGGDQPVGLLRRKLTPAAGNRTFSARGWSGVGNFVVDGGAGGAGAAMPMFIRVVKA